MALAAAEATALHSRKGDRRTGNRRQRYRVDDPHTDLHRQHFINQSGLVLSDGFLDDGGTVEVERM